jgi:membrane protein DedA with SNARE-associated domain
MHDWLSNVVVNYPILVYGVIAIVGFIEGPILALFCGILYRLGYLYIIPVYIALMMGDLIGDCFWYWIGRTFGHRFVSRFGKFFSVDEKSIRTVSKVFHRYRDPILLVSKLTMGLGFALVTLITAGMVRIPFKRYLALNVLGQFVWTALLLAVGYLFGHLYVSFDDLFSRLFLAMVLVIAVAALFGFGKYVRQRFSRSEAE